MKTGLKGLDPRSKLVLVLCLSTLGVFIQDIGILTAVLCVSIALSTASGSRLFVLIRKFRRILWLFVAIAVIQSIFAPSGRVLVSLGGIKLITAGGLYKGVAMVLRMSIVMVSATIMATSNSREIVQGLVQWKVPYEIAFMVSVAIRFLPLLTDEIKNVVTAVQLRGIELDRIPARQRVKVYSYLIMPVVSGAVIKSRELATTMETRAFRAYPKRTSYMVLTMQRIDYTVIITSLITSILTLILYIKC
ncbi:MAG: energy-coupling factor transporter transmembrane component T [Bacillota bacterium]|nr:energy-coupling factor transporter transmembrane component T [Bacillota bacterium]MDD3298821.1 energy-coupling factor transporter transmembrane component T [Bacillota bacterium]MDD3851400.1 energy-coupling factor transporter transmembrane component T [Bacillota bacterium]MDD4708223.1 energy-coupling factor transporter transmembrane component T [Bacillota bacterium]